MRKRRFTILVGILVALNVALWLTPVGLATRQDVISNLFGKNLVRGSALEVSGAYWYFDRGVITSVSSSKITLQEADGYVTKPAIILAPSTHFIGVDKPRQLKNGWRVFVTSLATPAGTVAQTVQVEKRGH